MSSGVRASARIDQALNVPVTSDTTEAVDALSDLAAILTAKSLGDIKAPYWCAVRELGFIFGPGVHPWPSRGQSAVEGAINGARELGLNAEQSASATASGAIKGAGEISTAAVDEVRKAVTGVIAGVKVAVKEPFRKDESAKQERKVS